MIKVEEHIKELISILKLNFGSRLLYVGLQGSYLRGEANELSDLDIMVVIDALSVDDLALYRKIIQSLDYFDKSCGFICSQADLANWNPLEIFHLIHSTKDYFGELKTLVPEYTEQDIRNFVKMSINNLYHEICHRFVHSNDNKSISYLAGSYKGVFFILQNLYYLKYKRFIPTKAELLQMLDNYDYVVLKRSIDLNNGMIHDFDESFELLFAWCQNTLVSL